jgi:hypothetical protein
MSAVELVVETPDEIVVHLKFENERKTLSVEKKGRDAIGEIHSMLKMMKVEDLSLWHRHLKLNHPEKFKSMVLEGKGDEHPNKD